MNLILYQIEVYRNSRAEKEKISGFFKKLVENFFVRPVERTCEFDCFTSTDISKLLSDSFSKRRVAMLAAPISATIDAMRLERVPDAEEEKLAEMQRRLKAGRNRGSRAPAHLNSFPELSCNPAAAARSGQLEFELVPKSKDDARFVPASGGDRGLLFATQHYYSMFRHMYCLYERLMRAKKMIHKNVGTELGEGQSVQTVDSVAAECYSAVFLKSVRTFIGGTIDVTKYEEVCQHYLGQQAYLLFTVESLMASVFATRCNMPL